MEEITLKGEFEIKILITCTKLEFARRVGGILDQTYVTYIFFIPLASFLPTDV